MVQAGDQAPDFTLPSTAGSLTLSDVWQASRVLLTFYIEDGTPG